MSRRDFLLRAGGTAIAVPSLAAILAACTKPGTGSGVAGASASEVRDLLSNPARPDNPVTLPLFEDPIPTDTPIEEGATLQLYNWKDYLWPKLYTEFEDKYADYGVKIEVTTFNDIAQGIQKVSSGQIAADVFFPDPSWIAKLSVAQLMRPLNHELLPNLATYYWPEFQNPFYDQGWQYTVPYTIYTTGIAYRRDHISDDDVRAYDNPYEILWDPKYTGKVTIYDDYRETIGMALLKNGITDVNTEDPADIQIAKDDLLALINATDARLTINGIYSKMPQDEFWVGGSWSGDIVAAAIYYLPKGVPASVLGYWYPDDGWGHDRQRSDGAAAEWEESSPRSRVPQFHAGQDELVQQLRQLQRLSDPDDIDRSERARPRRDPPFAERNRGRTRSTSTTGGSCSS